MRAVASRLDGRLGARRPDGSTTVLVVSVTCADQLAVVGPEFGAMLTGLGATD